MPTSEQHDAALAARLVAVGPIKDALAALVSEVVLDFQQTPGAGTYEVSIPVAAHSWIHEVFAVCINGPWDDDDTEISMWDEDQDEGDPGWISGLGLNNVGDVGTPFDPQGITFPNMYENLDGLGGAYSDAGYWKDGVDARTQPGLPYHTANTITAKVTDAGAGGTTGHLQIIIRGSGMVGGFYEAVKTPA